MSRPKYTPGEIAADLRQAREVIASSHEYAAKNRDLVQLTLSESRSLQATLERAAVALEASEKREQGAGSAKP